ncbi:putative nuclease HARBI1 [Apostichopus japonicus]|uniref:Putative nuclease HARBI1 n=1 Tax=Stichopus japonicus TaxID=307972 RepID=A0A2G8L480_STIJA|nr:putative nuclease HARBI1 [Apostichopus japonicus]
MSLAKLEHPTNRSRALSASLQVINALRFHELRSKSALAGCASLHGCSKSSASRALRRVTRALVQIRNDEIQFLTTPASVTKARGIYFLVAGFPQVVGTVYGTLTGIHGSNYGPDDTMAMTVGYYVKALLGDSLRTTNFKGYFLGTIFIKYSRG